MGIAGRVVFLLLMGIEGQALEVVENWDKHGIQQRYESEEAFYSRAMSYLSYEGPFGLVSTAVYRIYDNIDSQRLRAEAKACKKKAKSMVLESLDCALEQADIYVSEVLEANGLCRVSAEVTRILINNLGLWQLRAWNRNLTLKAYGHVVNGVRIETTDGPLDYVIDVGNWGSELFPLNKRAKNYHIQFSTLPNPAAGPRPFPSMSAL